MSTLVERQHALLADLITEQGQYGPRWEAYYDRKIAEMREAIYGSGAGDSTRGSTELQDVSGGAPQVVRESGDANSTVSV